jgi:hypothetical protein
MCWHFHIAWNLRPGVLADSNRCTHDSIESRSNRSELHFSLGSSSIDLRRKLESFRGSVVGSTKARTSLADHPGENPDGRTTIDPDWETQEDHSVWVLHSG